MRRISRDAVPAPVVGITSPSMVEDGFGAGAAGVISWQLYQAPQWVQGLEVSAFRRMPCLQIRRISVISIAMTRVFHLLPAAALALLLNACQQHSQVSSPVSLMESNSESKVTSTTNSSQVVKSDEEWRKILTPEQYRVLRHAATERPFGPAYEEFKKQGAG